MPNDYFKDKSNSPENNENPIQKEVSFINKFHDDICKNKEQTNIDRSNE